jgi:hypothetical protein
MPIEGIDKDDNPLGFVDRLRDEERDTLLHFGDVRFWQHIEYIDTKEIYRTKSLEYRTVKLMCFEFFFYFVFLVNATLYIYNARPNTLYGSTRQQLDYWGGCKRGRGPDTYEGRRTCDFQKVNDHKSMMDWLRFDFVPLTYTGQTEFKSLVEATSIFRLQKGVSEWKPRYAGDTNTSVMVGAARIRQLRVQFNRECTIKEEWGDIQSDCMPGYTPGRQSRLSWAPTWLPNHLLDHFKFYTANYTEMTNVQGYHGWYPADGFFFDVPTNISGAQLRLLELEQWSWLDIRTRAVVVEFSTLNPNVNIFAHNRFLFEFPATGGVVSKHEVFAFQILRLSMSLMVGDDIPTFIFHTLTFGLHMMFLIYVIYIFYKNGLRYFKYLWSWVDIFILCNFFLYLAVQMYTYYLAYHLPNLEPEVMPDPEMFFPIGSITPWIEFSDFILAVHALAIWVKVLKYLSLGGSFLALIRVLERCILNLMMFEALLIIVLIGFALAFHIGYGGEADLFSTVYGSFVATIVASAGGVSLDSIFQKDDGFGTILVLLYFLLVFLLLLNIFAAICVDTYSICIYELSVVKKHTKHNPVAVFAWTYIMKLGGTDLVGKESEEDKGRPDEQTIALSNLPEAIQTRYLEEEREMTSKLQAIAEEEERKRRLQEDPDDDEEEDVGGLPPMRPSMLSLQDEVRSEASEEEQDQRAEDYEKKIHSTVVKRVQLQRMLDDYPILQEISGTKRAIELMRRFRVDAGSVDPYQAVAKLQANVAKKLKEIEKTHGLQDFDELETLRTVSQELHSALTDSQKEWREELLSVMQMATLLSESLMMLTARMEDIQKGHKELCGKVGPTS